MRTDILPVILSGGSGTRLWPLSRESYPKQFLPLLDGASPFQATLARLEGLPGARPPAIVANQEHRFLAQHQLAKAKVKPGALYLEPFGRNTAPAIALVALDLCRDEPDTLMLVLPADHDIPDHDAFHEAVLAGAQAARRGCLVVFGVPAVSPETGFGYIEQGEPLEGCEGVRHVARFVEKPELEIAKHFVASGKHAWNSGMFLFSARRYLEELQRFEPELAEACREVASVITEKAGARPIPADLFADCKSVSIDYAVLERTDAAAMVPGRFRWSDIGSWNALWERGEHDADSNSVQGDVDLTDVSNSYVQADGRLVVAIGVDNLLIVDTPDALLVADRSQCQRVREAVARLKDQGRVEARDHTTVHRPWGHYEDLDQGERFRVKRICVQPGAQLSLQMHHHRAEHWVVVRGTAKVTRGDETLLLSENQSTYIPLGTTHRLENPGKIPLEIVEIQSGAYLGEDDIVRLQDAYQRA